MTKDNKHISPFQQSLIDFEASLRRSEIVTPLMATVTMFHMLLEDKICVEKVHLSILECTTTVIEHRKYMNCDVTWLDILTVATSAEEGMSDTLEAIRVMWNESRKLATGISIQNTRKKRGHVNFNQIKEIETANTLAGRFLQLSSESCLTMSPQPGHAKIQLSIDMLTASDTMTRCFACGSLLNELAKTQFYKKELAVNVAEPAAKLLLSEASAFYATGDDLVWTDKSVVYMVEELNTAKRRFSEELFRVTQVSDENNLDLALIHYVEDEENKALAKAYYHRENITTKLKECRSTLQSQGFDATVRFAIIRSAGALLSQCVSNALDLPSAGVEPLEVFEDFRRAKRVLEANQASFVEPLLAHLPWRRLAVLAGLERRLCESTSLLSALAATASRLSCSCQEIVCTYFVRDAFTNICMDPGPLWYNMIIPGNAHGKHQLNLATRIHSVTCLWGLWHQSDKRIQEFLSLKYHDDLMWPHLLDKMDERSRKIHTSQDYEDVDEYIRDFREIEAIQGNYMSSDFFEGKLLYEEGCPLAEASEKWDKTVVSKAGIALEELQWMDGRPWGDSDEWVNGDDDGSDSDTDKSVSGSDDSDEERDRMERPHRSEGASSKLRTKPVPKTHRECLDWYLLKLASGVGSILDQHKPEEAVEHARRLSAEEVHAARYIHRRAETAVAELLDDGLEGPGDISSRRCAHPMDILLYLMSRDGGNSVPKLVMENVRMHVAPPMAVLRSDEYFDEHSQYAALEFMTRLIVGSRPAFLHPSHSPSHTHFMDQCLSPGAKEALVPYLPDLKAMVRTMCVDALYGCQPHHVVPFCFNGDSQLQRVLSILIALASVDVSLTIALLADACEAMKPAVAIPGEKDKAPAPNPHWVQFDEQRPWLGALLLIVRGAVDGMCNHCLESHWWPDEWWRNQDFWHNCGRVSLPIQRSVSDLLAVMTMQDRELNQHIAAEYTPWVSSLLDALVCKDAAVRRSLLWLCYNIVEGEKTRPAPGNTVSAPDVPFDSLTNLFRAAMIHEGNALESAVDALQEAAFTWQSTLGQSQEWQNDPHAAERERREDTSDPTAATPGERQARESLLKYAPKTLRDAQQLLPPVTPYMLEAAGTDETVAAPTEISSTRSKSSRFGLADRAHNVGRKKKKRMGKDGIMEEDEDDGLNGMTTWEFQDAFARCEMALDTAVIAMEFITSYCEGRLEWQKIVRQRSPGFFTQLPSFLASLTLSDAGAACKKFFAKTEKFMMGFHPGVAAAATRTIRAIVRRHAEARAIVCNSGCVEALMDCLTRGIEIKDDVLCNEIVLTIEQMIIRNNDTWKYIQATGGVEGLLRLMEKGNTSVRILACAALTLDIQRPGQAGQFFRMDVVDKGVVDVLRPLIVNEDHDTQLSAMVLLQNCMPSRRARNQVLQPVFLRQLARCLRSDDLAVMRGACEILVTLGSEQQADVRERMYDQTGAASQSGDEAMMYLATTVERLVDIVAGQVVSIAEPVGGLGEKSECLTEKELSVGPPDVFRREVLSLSNAAANVLASMTDGDEADWPDGAPPLKETLVTSGIFPKLDSLG